MQQERVEVGRGTDKIYGWNWEDWLGDDVILTSSWDLTGPDAEVSLHDASATTTAAQCWVLVSEDAIPGKEYKATNTITTDTTGETERFDLILVVV